MSNPAEGKPDRDQFTVAITCQKCGQVGSAVWEENSTASLKGPQTFLVSLSSGFYERIARTKPHLIELVCHRCETVQSD